MTGDAQKARNFLESLQAYADTPMQQKPPEDRPTKLGTIDPLYAGVGLPKVLFDGESIMGVRGYQWTGPRPRASDRVFLIPQGSGYVIGGVLGDTRGDDTGWIAVSSFQNSFSGGGSVGPAYRRLGGIVYIRGEVLRSTAPSSALTAFTLPVGFRPGIRHRVMNFAINQTSPVSVTVQSSTGDVDVASDVVRSATPGYSVAASFPADG